MSFDPQTCPGCGAPKRRDYCLHCGREFLPQPVGRMRGYISGAAPFLALHSGSHNHANLYMDGVRRRDPEYFQAFAPKEFKRK